MSDAQEPGLEGASGSGARRGRQGRRRADRVPGESARSSTPEREGDPESRAHGICLRLLTAAPRTRASLAEALRRREIPDDAAERVLDRLAEVGLVDDPAFARAWVQSRHHGRGLARRALSHELRARGVEPETVEAAVEQIGPEDEYARAAELVDRRLASTRGLAREVRVRRLAGLLARKGYSAGVASRAVLDGLQREAEQQDAHPDDDPDDHPDDHPDGHPVAVTSPGGRHGVDELDLDEALHADSS